MSFSLRRASVSLVIPGLALFSADVCLAGRPLAVDDANINDVGAGHVETWYARQAGASNNLTVAPAYGLAQGVEVAAALSRDRSNKVNSSSVQAKFRLTESRSNGCNIAAVLGLTHTNANDGSDNAPYLNGIATCNMNGGAVHFNLGAIHPAGSSTQKTWGLSYERDLGSITADIEYFGQQHNRPTAQFGLSSEIVKNIQLDGTVGRTGGDTVYSLGMKFMF
jgi:hypothetical protein